ncbi:MAG: hypothetical protein ACLGG0_08545 [Bacteriovoracia bacterium]
MKSALRFNLTLILLSSLLLMGATVKDRYLFRVTETVVGVHDLEVAVDDLKALECRFPDSLLMSWLGDGFSPKLKKVTAELLQSQESVSKDHSKVIFLSMVRQMWKVLVFTDTQDVVLKPELEKQVINVAGCPTVLFTKKEMRDSFKRWLKVEIYLRSRYAPGGITENKEWRAKRLNSIAQFVDSIDKQMSHENFW